MSTVHYLPTLTAIDLANIVSGKLPEKFHIAFDNMVDEGTNNLRKTYIPPVSFYQNDDIEETGDDAYFVQNVYLDLPEGRNKFLLEYSYHYGELEIKIESDLLTKKMHSEGSFSDTQFIDEQILDQATTLLIAWLTKYQRQLKSIIVSQAKMYLKADSRTQRLIQKDTRASSKVLYYLGVKK